MKCVFLNYEPCLKAVESSEGSWVSVWMCGREWSWLRIRLNFLRNQWRRPNRSPFMSRFVAVVCIRTGRPVATVRKLRDISQGRWAAWKLYWRFTAEFDDETVVKIDHHLAVLQWYSDSDNNNDDDHFVALCPGLPGWAGTRRNTHPATILIIIESYQLLPSTTIHSILLVQITWLAIWYSDSEHYTNL